MRIFDERSVAVTERIFVGIGVAVHAIPPIQGTYGALPSKIRARWKLLCSGRHRAQMVLGCECGLVARSFGAKIKRAA
jgi:hypothetical protein